jgi:hypothetical protein
MEPERCGLWRRAHSRMSTHHPLRVARRRPNATTDEKATNMGGGFSRRSLRSFSTDVAVSPEGGSQPLIEVSDLVTGYDFYCFATQIAFLTRRRCLSLTLMDTQRERRRLRGEIESPRAHYAEVEPFQVRDETCLVRTAMSRADARTYRSDDSAAGPALRRGRRQHRGDRSTA